MENRASLKFVVSFILIAAAGSCSLKSTKQVEPVPATKTEPPQTSVSKQPVSGEATEVKASYYGKGDNFAGKKTASGEKFNPNDLTAAHKTLPFNTVVEVTNPRTGQKVDVRVNDRGPHTKGRNLDVSAAAAKQIGLDKQGVGSVHMKVKKQPDNAEKDSSAPDNTRAK